MTTGMAGLGSTDCDAPRKRAVERFKDVFADDITITTLLIIPDQAIALAVM
jgi:hypothetical protein